MTGDGGWGGIAREHYGEMGSARIPLTDKIGSADWLGPDFGLTLLSHNFHFRIHPIFFY